VAARHHPVEDPEIRRGLARERERLVAVAGFDHAVAGERLLHEKRRKSSSSAARIVFIARPCPCSIDANVARA
jgi:hypothetical protein